MQVPATRNKGQPTKQLHNHVTRLGCWSIGSPTATRKYCAYHTVPDIFPTLPFFSLQSASPRSPTCRPPCRPTTVKWRAWKYQPFFATKKDPAKSYRRRYWVSHQDYASSVAQKADKSHRGHANRHNPRQKLRHPSRAQRSESWRPLSHCKSPLEGKKKRWSVSRTLEWTCVS